MAHFGASMTARGLKTSDPASTKRVRLTLSQRLLFLALFVFSLISSSDNLRAESAQFRQFRSDYGLMSLDLLNNPAEIATVKDFVYTKDAATFTFKEGKLIFLRFLNDRPTTALFIGTGPTSGSVRIEIPHRLERENLKQISGDTLVDQTFEVCAIRFADDFDKLAKEKFSFTASKLDWADYNRVMKAQSESYFAPTIYTQFDNHTQLVWSAMDRSADGFFWIDFGRYAYSYDPNRPEQIDVLYEREASDEYMSIGARFKKAGERPSSDFELSRISYPVKISERMASISLGGLDGTHFKRAEVTLKGTVEVDKLRLIPIYVDRRQTVDTVWVNDKIAEFWSRNDHARCYLFPEQPVEKGEEINIRIVYHGNDYSRPLPWVDDPAAVYTQVSYDAPKGFNYYAPGMSKIEVVGGRQKFSTLFDPLVRDQNFASVGTGSDSVALTTPSGFPITFIKIRAYSRGGIPDTKYQETILATYDALASILGNPPATFGLTVIPYGGRQAPGFASIPQLTTDLDGTGGFTLTAAMILAEQWFGITAQPAGVREEWLLYGLKQSVAQLALQIVKKGAGEMFSEINDLANQVATARDRQMDRPIAGQMDWRLPAEQSTGQTASQVVMNQSIYRSSKAGLVMNQLRFELYDLDGQSEDAAYRKLVRELSSRVNSAPYTNADIAAILQKYTGRDMTAFFESFVFGGDLPEISGSYHLISAESGPVVDWEILVKNVPKDFSAPVVLQIGMGKESKFVRQLLTAGENRFRTDGLSAAPTEAEFNKFFGLLSRDNVKKGK